MSFAEGIKLIEANFPSAKTYIVGSGKDTVISIELGRGIRSKFNTGLIDQLISYGWSYDIDNCAVIYQEV